MPKKTNTTTTKQSVVRIVPCPGGCGGFTNGGECGSCYDKSHPGWRERLPR